VLGSVRCGTPTLPPVGPLLPGWGFAGPALIIEQFIDRAKRYAYLVHETLKLERVLCRRHFREQVTDVVEESRGGDSVGGVHVCALYPKSFSVDTRILEQHTGLDHAPAQPDRVTRRDLASVRIPEARLTATARQTPPKCLIENARRRRCRMASMPRRYPPEFRRKVLDLLKDGRKIAEVAVLLRVRTDHLHVRNQEPIDTGQRPAVSSTDHAEMIAARKRSGELETELAVNKRANELLKESVSPKGMGGRHDTCQQSRPVE
jgi:transposase